jgi:hypothetical protein
MQLYHGGVSRDRAKRIGHVEPVVFICVVIVKNVFIYVLRASRLFYSMISKRINVVPKRTNFVPKQANSI